MIFFHSNHEDHGYLNNDYFGDFTVGIWKFSCMTKYMSFCKAKLFGDEERARKVIDERGLYEMRQWGKAVENSEGFNEKVWNAQVGIILYRGLKAKFDQNPQFITGLVKTGDELLVYCDTVDEVLGTGLGMSDPDRGDMSKWTGQNLLGFALMDLRSEYQAQMPESLREEVRAGSNGEQRFDLAGGLSGEGFVIRFDRECRYDPYEGDAPYIYLNYSLHDISEALRTVEVLNRLGYNVWYDRLLDDGRLWSEKRADAVECCSLMLDIHNGENHTSHVQMYAREFAELLEIPVIDVCMDEKQRRRRAYERAVAAKKAAEEAAKAEEPVPEPEVEERDLSFVDAHVKDKDFSEYCQAVLEHAGFPPGMEWPEGSKRKKPRCDLLFNYYDDYNEGRGLFGSRDWYLCNLRTREVFHKNGKRAMREINQNRWKSRNAEREWEPLYLTDEEVYKASMWKLRDFDAGRKSKELEYIGTPEDWAFTKRVSGLGGEYVPEAVSEYREARKRIEQAEKDYPYMDEFEYVNSRFDDDD